MKDHDKERRQGQFHHKIFKFVVLVIVAVFFCLIIGFIYIEFFGSKGTGEKFSNYIIQSKSKRYDYLKTIDQSYYQPYYQVIPSCDLSRFYYEHISQSVPCVVRYETANQHYKNHLLSFQDAYRKNDLLPGSAEFLSFASKYLKYSQMTIFNQYNLFNKGAYTDDKAKFYIQINGKSNYAVTPLSMTNDLNPIMNETYKKFNKIYSDKDLLNESTMSIVLKNNLNEGDMLYVPSYFYIQGVNINQNSNDQFDLILYEYEGESRLLNNLFITLFDDNIIKDEDIEEY